MGVTQHFLLAGLRALALMLAFFMAGAQANSDLSKFLTEVQVADIFPGATHLTETASTPPVAEAWADKKLLGYVYLNSDFVNSAGYSSKPIHILIGLALDGEIKGAKLVKHDEPIVLIGIPIARVNHFIDGYIGLNFIKNPPVGRMAPPVDIISGATVTLMVIGDSITRSSLLVARATSAASGQAAAAPKAKISIDTSQTDIQDWDHLLNNGSVSRMLLTNGDVNQAFKESGNLAAAEHPEPGDPDDTFIDLYTAQVSIPSIGRSL
ncbi:FMN-binding protein, partial [Photobacterium phosphoreum]|uniref:FMN-binding protein n=1 Tax=Photobacterium phosphoreum TaxID=659 RepID=UPI001E62E117